MQDVINIHTGSSCPSNPGPGGYAAVIELRKGLNASLRGLDPNTTNNRIEAVASFRALEALEKIQETEG